MRGSTAGLPDNLQGYNTKYYNFLTILDSLFALFVVCPCVVGYWRSVWGLMEIYLTPNNQYYSALISIAIGIGGHLFFTVFQKVFENNFHPDKNRILYYFVSRSYTTCYAFTCVNGWRGPWIFLDFHSEVNIYSLLICLLIGVVALISVKGLRNVTAPPCIIVNDGVKGYFEVVTMFRIPMGDKALLYVLDCTFSILIVGTLVVFVWRGVWLLLDIYLFPEDPVLSSWGSMIIGYLAVAVAFLLQPLMRHICERLNGTPRLLVADCFVLFALFGTVNVWRAIWNLLNIYFLPDNMELSCWITHWACLILLILFGCSNSLLVRGVYIDAEEPAGKCVIFPCYYLRVIFRRKKLKKLNIANCDLNALENNHSIKISTICINTDGNHAVKS